MHSVTAVKKELDKIGVAYLENALMSAHTTFRIGGPAALYVRPQNREELVAAARDTNGRNSNNNHRKGKQFACL